jgi:hypothetical protein
MVKSGGKPKIPSKLPPQEAALVVGGSEIDGGAEAVADGKAVAEAQQLSGDSTIDELRRQAEASDHGRNERFKDALEKIANVAMWVAAALILTITVVWVYHLVMPASCQWLTPSQFDKIQSILVSVAVSSVVTAYFQKRLS